MSISPVFVSQNDQFQFANATRLRDLDSFEEFFWLIAQSVNVSHSVVVDVIGPTTVDQWWEAMEAVQTRYPLLSASIRKIPGRRPFFEKVEGASMPFRISPLPGPMMLEQEMEIELEKSFGRRKRPSHEGNTLPRSRSLGDHIYNTSQQLGWKVSPASSSGCARSCRRGRARQTSRRTTWSGATAWFTSTYRVCEENGRKTNGGEE